MPLVGSPLNLPAAEETLAFRALEAVLRDDPTLKAVVKTWTSWKGEPGDLLAPSAALAPFVALSLRAQGATWETERQHRNPIVVVLTIATAGTNCDDLTNLWGAIRRAVFPQDEKAWEAVSRRLRDEGRVTKPTMTTGAYGAVSDGQGKPANCLVARGAIELLQLVRT